MDSLNNFLSAPVIWFLLGLVFMLLEFILPGLIVLFFGIGAWVTAILTYFFDFNLNVQLVIFIISSLSSLILLRKYFQKIFVGKNDSVDDELEEYIGRTATAAVDFEKGKAGKVIFKGTNWTAFSDSEIKEGEEVKIVGKESIKLKVEPINKN